MSGRPALFRLTFRFGAVALAAFLALPMLALLYSTGVGGLVRGLKSEVAHEALLLTLATSLTSVALVVLCGIPLAWTLARSPGPTARVVERLLQVPIVVPPAVTGVALLLAFGRQGLVGQYFADRVAIAFTPAAVVMAEAFVCAPFFLQAATTAFRQLDERALDVARTLGASEGRLFVKLALPLAAPGLLGGMAVAWARAAGEFGATLLFAGNLPGRTQTLPLAIYTALESDLEAAKALSVVLIALGVTTLLLASKVVRR